MKNIFSTCAKEAALICRMLRTRSVHLEPLVDAAATDVEHRTLTFIVSRFVVLYTMFQPEILKVEELFKKGALLLHYDAGFVFIEVTSGLTHR